MRKYRNPQLLATLVIFSFIASFSAHVYAKESADVIFINGQIETLNSKQSNVNAVAIKNEKFIAVGSNQKIKTYIGSSTKVVDLNQQFVVRINRWPYPSNGNDLDERRLGGCPLSRYAFR